MLEPTKITMTSYDTTVSWEIPDSDIDINRMMEGVVSCLLALTFNKQTILSGMKKYLEENA
jgi:hypothetical protein